MSDSQRLVEFEAIFWQSLGSFSELELLKLAEFSTANTTTLPHPLTVNLSECERNAEGGAISGISARTCTNELTIPDYRVGPSELSSRLRHVLQVFDMLPQFDTI
eukprot:SAG31_NODE_4645_length_3075_cov_147.262433_3_plen_105_part_00